MLKNKAKLIQISHSWSNAIPIKNEIVPVNRGNVARGLNIVVSLLGNIENPTILEIGSEIGGSAKYFMENVRHKPNIICLDVWKVRGLGTGFFSNENASKKADEAASITKKIGTFSLFAHQVKAYKENIFPIKGDRLKSIKKIHDLGIEPDLVYVDCMHTYPECLHDLELIRKLFPNAIITGDDYFSSNLEVMKSVEEFAEKQNTNYCVYGTQFVFPFNLDHFPDVETYPKLQKRLDERGVKPGSYSREPGFFNSKKIK